MLTILLPLPEADVLEHDLKGGSGVSGRTVYSESKFVNLLAAHWWRRQLTGQCDVVAVSPGLIAGTGIGRGHGMQLTMDMPDAKSVPEGKQRESLIDPSEGSMVLVIMRRQSLTESMARRPERSSRVHA